MNQQQWFLDLDDASARIKNFMRAEIRSRRTVDLALNCGPAPIIGSAPVYGPVGPPDQAIPRRRV